MICDTCGQKIPRTRQGEKATPSKRKAKSKLVDGQVTTDWNKTLTQFTAADLNRISLNLTQNTGQAREGLTDYLVDIISNLETVDWEIPDSLPNVCMRSPDLTAGNPSIQAWQIMAVVPASLRSCRPTGSRQWMRHHSQVRISQDFLGQRGHSRLVRRHHRSTS